MESSDKMKFKCPECGKKLAADVRFAGKKVRCPKCTYVFEVPAPDTADDIPLSEEVESKLDLSDQLWSFDGRKPNNSEEPEGGYPEFGDIKLRIKGCYRTIANSYQRMEPLGKGIIICGSLLVLLGIFFWVVLPIFGLMFIHENDYGVPRGAIDAIREHIRCRDKKHPHWQVMKLISVSTFDINKCGQDPPEEVLTIVWCDGWNQIRPATRDFDNCDTPNVYAVKGFVRAKTNTSSRNRDLPVYAYYTWDPSTERLQYVKFEFSGREYLKKDFEFYERAWEESLDYKQKKREKTWYPDFGTTP